LNLPVVSLIIPTFQRPALLSRALQSAGSPPWLETVVIDDDPAMSAADIVKGYAGVRYIAKRGINRGLSASRNLGLSVAHGRYVCFLDDDDFFTPGGLESLLNATSSAKSFYYANFNLHRKDKVELKVLDSVRDTKLLVANQIPVGCYLMERSSIQRPFDDCMKSHEDWDFLLKNIDWECAEYIRSSVVNIDKTRDDDTSMQVRRKGHFWMDFIRVYSTFPAPHLNKERVIMLKKLGISVPVELLPVVSTF